MTTSDAKDRYERATRHVERVLKRAGLEQTLDRSEKERLVMFEEVELRDWTPKDATRG